MVSKHYKPAERHNTLSYVCSRRAHLKLLKERIEQAHGKTALSRIFSSQSFVAVEE